MTKYRKPSQPVMNWPPWAFTKVQNSEYNMTVMLVLSSSFACYNYLQMYVNLSSYPCKLIFILDSMLLEHHALHLLNSHGWKCCPKERELTILLKPFPSEHYSFVHGQNKKELDLRARMGMTPRASLVRRVPAPTCSSAQQSCRVSDLTVQRENWRVKREDALQNIGEERTHLPDSWV